MRILPNESQRQAVLWDFGEEGNPACTEDIKAQLRRGLGR